MAKSRTARKRKTTKKAAPSPAEAPVRYLLPWFLRGAGALLAAFLLLLLLFAFVNPVVTPYMLAESWRQGGVARDWVPLEEMAPEMARAVVAAEDANFCLHWGFDMTAIRAALDEGSGRGASTLSQQVTKNVFLWQGRSWLRKALEAVMTPVVEMVWTKRRIVEVYLNVAETGIATFGAEAAARRYFGIGAADLSPRQAALIAAALPDPKRRDPVRPSDFLNRRARAIAEGAATIRADGRAACFED